MFSPIKKFIPVIIIIIVLTSNSCVHKKNVIYFQNAKDFESMVDTETYVGKFKVDDEVSIYVSAFDMEAVRPFNLFKGGGASSNPELISYLIDNEGNIDYPVLGKVKLLGLTVEEAKNVFREKLSEYLKNPIINIRILNYRISVLGEVRNPGRFDISGERVSLLEAIAMAGDLTIKGKRKNVLIIRDFNGNKTYTRVDLTNKELFNSPVYYLTQNDVVYIQPNKSAISTASLDSRISTAISIASIVITSSILLLTRN